MENKDITLCNGVQIPQLGLGVYKVDAGGVCRGAVADALLIGYRHIDTAAFYGNEQSVGEGIAESGVDRGEVFLTSKVWNDAHGYDNTLRAFDRSLQRLGTEYLDLYLIHWPKTDNIGTWRALERVYREGRARAIGVSNFKEHHLDELLAVCEVAPMLNQVELHPRFQQSLLREYCKERHIAVEAWKPLMRGDVFSLPLFGLLGEKYGKTAAQIVLRWNIQLGIVTIPKTVHADRMRENADIFDFTLSAEDMRAIALLDDNLRTGADPDNVPF